MAFLALRRRRRARSTVLRETAELSTAVCSDGAATSTTTTTTTMTSPNRRQRSRLRLLHLAVHAQRRRNHAANVAHIARHNDRRALLGQAPKRVDILLRHAQRHRTLRRRLATTATAAAIAAAAADALAAKRARNSRHAGRRRLGAPPNRLGLAVRAVHLLGAQRLRRQDDALLAALGNVDGALALALAVEDLGALAALGGHLPVHGGDDGLRRVDVAYLVAQAHDAPRARRLVDGLRDVGVERGALLEHVVERQLADFAAHGRLRQLRDGVLGVLDSIAILYPCKKKKFFSVFS